MSQENNFNRKRDNSYVWPILLIGVGVIVLLINLGIVPGNIWRALIRFWPVLLILIGVDLIIGHRSAAAAAISAFIALAVVGGLIGMLVLMPDSPIFDRLTASPDLKIASMTEPLDQVQFADVTIDWDPGINRLSSLSASSSNLIEAELEYYGELEYRANSNSTHGELRIDARQDVAWFNFPNFSDTEWTIELHPSVTYDLNLDMGSGPVELFLGDLILEGLLIDGGSGPVELYLPQGNYEASLDQGSGPLKVYLPAGIEVQIDVDSGSGPLVLPSEFSLLRGERNADGLWETSGYDGAAERVNIKIDQGSGPITIEFFENK